MPHDIQQEHKQIHIGARARVIKQRPVTFRCAWCNQLVTELRYPGPTPRYGMQCKAEAMRYAEATKKARQRNARPPQKQRTTTCWDSPTNLLAYGYIDPGLEHAEDVQRVHAALDARNIDRADANVRQFLEECGM